MIPSVATGDNETRVYIYTPVQMRRERRIRTVCGSYGWRRRSSSSMERVARHKCGGTTRNSRRCVERLPFAAAAAAAAGVVVGTSDPAVPGEFVSADTFVRTRAG